jgi:bifunctional UDP-N-acetylglucosamine pyrophosphorylase/glucosamine-1-phosphate N-acetyltransferase
MKNSVFVIISALQGESSAMNSAIPLILHSVCGRSMLRHALAAAGCLTGNPPLVIFDGDGEALEEHLAEAEISDLISVKYSTLSEWFQVLARHSSGYEYLIQLPANLPLLSAAALEGLLQFTAGNQLDAVIMSEDEDAWTTIKPGHAVLCFRTKWLYDALSIHARQLEAMPPDALNFKGFLETGEAGKAIFHPPHPEELMSVTDRICLAEAEARMRLRINESHMRKGVTFIDPSHTYIGPDVHISRDTIIYPGNVLEGSTVIGSGCILYPGNRLHNALIGDKVSLQSSVVLDSSVGHETTVGPYAYIRPGSRIGSHARIGDFVEIKKSLVGRGSKISHLSYVGDAEIGENVNIGCGVVCVNYDGKRKQKVTVGDHAFVGCNVNLVAPVEVESHAYVAAGSTITERVPSKALAIARARQVNKEGWVDKREEREQKKTEENQ